MQARCQGLWTKSQSRVVDMWLMLPAMPTQTAAVPGMQNISNISRRVIQHFFAATGLLLSEWSRVKSSPSELPLTAIGGGGDGRADGLQCIRRRRRRNPQVGWGRKTRETNERRNGTHATRNENPPARSVRRSVELPCMLFGGLDPQCNQTSRSEKTTQMLAHQI